MINKFKNFFFKRPQVVLDCFTATPHVYDNAKINWGIKFMPDWWKRTPRQLENGDLTVKNCVGLTDLYKTSIVIPSWFEMRLRVHSKHDQEDLWYTWEGSNESIVTDGSHADEQFEEFAVSHAHNIKLHSPWVFKTKEFVRFTWTQPTWNMRHMIEQLTILPAVVDYKYQHDTNINFLMLNKNQEFNVTIEPLTPLVMLHPMTDKEIVIKNHLVDQKEYDRIHNVDKLFIKDNRALYTQRKRKTDMIEKLGCPYAGKKQ